MPEPYGKLEGLRELIAPAAPLQEYQLPWLLLVICVLVLLLMLTIITRYRKRPLLRARRRYRKLVRSGVQRNANHYGDAITAILRIYSGCHNLNNAHVTVLDRQDWLALLDDCNRLRFAGVTDSDDVVERAIQKTRKLLWPTR